MVLLRLGMGICVFIILLSLLLCIFFKISEYKREKKIGNRRAYNNTGKYCDKTLKNTDRL